MAVGMFMSGIERMMGMSSPKLIYCHQCNRGGNGNDVDKCSCGWRQQEKSHLGCFLGVKIIGPIKASKKMPRSKQRYKRYLQYGDGFDSFLDFCYWDASADRSWNKTKKAINRDHKP